MLWALGCGRAGLDDLHFPVLEYTAAACAEQCQKHPSFAALAGLVLAGSLILGARWSLSLKMSVGF